MSLAREDGFAPLNGYGFLSDGQAGALVAADGRVDWLAAPWMDRSPLCAALLDPAQGGTLELEPAVPYESEQRYVEGTLVLETMFRCADSIVRVTDALNRSVGGPLPWTELARRVEVVGDPVPMRWRIQLGHRLGSVRPWAERLGDTIYLHDSSARLAVVTDRAGEPQIQDAMVSGEFTAEADAPALVALVVAEDTPLIVPEPAAVQHRLDRTVGFWREWCQEIDYDGPHADEVRRSALVIKGLTRAPMEGLMAALTTSLPERIGGKRNFDYRFGWVRDASFALDAMSRLDLFEEVQGALAWLLRAVRRTAPEVRSMYTVEGEPAPAAMDSLEWLPGYRGSRPVNVGNTAASQLQLGGYGDLMDAVWRYCSGRARLDHDDAHALATLIDHTCDIWRSEDAGIW
ncbi:MAG: glycoside hydrolase family 15 protein, partial [Nocardioidaceae bacterium]